MLYVSTHTTYGRQGEVYWLIILGGWEGEGGVCTQMWEEEEVEGEGKAAAEVVWGQRA